MCEILVNSVWCLYSVTVSCPLTAAPCSLTESFPETIFSGGWIHRINGSRVVCVCVYAGGCVFMMMKARWPVRLWYKHRTFAACLSVNIETDVKCGSLLTPRGSSGYCRGGVSLVSSDDGGSRESSLKNYVVGASALGTVGCLLNGTTI